MSKVTPTDLRFSSLKGTKTVIHCDNKDEWEKVEQIVEHTFYLSFGEETSINNTYYDCIDISCLETDSFSIQSKKYYQEEGYTIIPASDFIASNTSDNGKGEGYKHGELVQDMVSSGKPLATYCCPNPTALDWHILLSVGGTPYTVYKTHFAPLPNPQLKTINNKHHGLNDTTLQGNSGLP